MPGWIADLGGVDTSGWQDLRINDWHHDRGDAAKINGHYRHAISSMPLRECKACCGPACSLATSHDPSAIPRSGLGWRWLSLLSRRCPRLRIARYLPAPNSSILQGSRWWDLHLFWRTQTHIASNRHCHRKRIRSRSTAIADAGSARPHRPVCSACSCCGGPSIGSTSC